MVAGSRFEAMLTVIVSEVVEAIRALAHGKSVRVLLYGILTSFSCASMNGIPAEIIQRAEDLVVMNIKGEDLVEACCQMPQDELEELEEAVCVA